MQPPEKIQYARVMRHNYIQTTWSKGLRERDIQTRLEKRSDTDYSLPGTGAQRYCRQFDSDRNGIYHPRHGKDGRTVYGNYDYPVIQGVVLVFTVMVLITNLLVDLSYGWLEPRVQYRKGSVSNMAKEFGISLENEVPPRVNELRSFFRVFPGRRQHGYRWP